jgi:hypothetical protein
MLAGSVNTTLIYKFLLVLNFKHGLRSNSAQKNAIPFPTINGDMLFIDDMAVIYACEASSETVQMRKDISRTYVLRLLIKAGACRIHTTMILVPTAHPTAKVKRELGAFLTDLDSKFSHW